MDFREILELVGITASIAGLGLFFVFYFTNEKFKSVTHTVLRKIPVSALLRLAASKVKDTKGVFDTHDALVVSGRLSDFLRNTINDPENTSFEDVEEEVFIFIDTELDRYRNAGVRGVPEISDESLRINVRVVFEQIKRALSENPS